MLAQTAANDAMYLVVGCAVQYQLLQISQNGVEDARAAFSAAALAVMGLSVPPLESAALFAFFGAIGDAPLPDPALPPELTITIVPLMNTPPGLMSMKLPPTFSDIWVPDSRTSVIPAFR